ncbi:MAG: T9SS type A sorting domain-containing protein [Bacteroidales bacterium]
MKSRILPFRLKALTLGTAGLLIASVSMGHEKDNSFSFTSQKTGVEAFSNTSIGNTVNASQYSSDLKADPAETTNKVNDWKTIGPSNFSGRITDVIVDNRDKSQNTIISASEYGGIYVSKNNGISWKKGNTGSKHILNASSMYQAANGTIYVSTGRNLERFENKGTGLYVSNGDKFDLIKSTSNTGNADWDFINKVCVDEKSNTIYAATGKGLKYSIDNGNSWNTAKDDQGNVIEQSVLDIQINDEGVKLITVRYLRNPKRPKEIEELIYRAEAGSNDFKNMCNDDAKSFGKEIRASRYALAFAPSNQNTCYAIGANLKGLLTNVYQSYDAGKTWSIVVPGKSALYEPLSDKPDATSGNGKNSIYIKVNPTDPETIYFGSLVLFEGKKAENSSQFFLTQVSDDKNQFFPNYIRNNINDIAFKNNSSEVFFATESGLFIGDISKRTYRASLSLLNSNVVRKVGLSREKNSAFFSSNNNGCLYVSEKVSNPNFARQFSAKSSNGTPINYGGFVYQSALDKELLVVTSSGQTIQRYDVKNKMFGSFLNNNLVRIPGSHSRVPIAIWESADFPYATDTIIYENPWKKDTIKAPRKIFAKHYFGKDRFYPISKTITKNVLPKDPLKKPEDPIISNSKNSDTIRVLSHVINKMYIVGEKEIFLTHHLPDFSKTGLGSEGNVFTAWPIVNFYDRDHKNNLGSCVAVSQNGNYLWAGLFDGIKETTRLIRCSNLLHAIDYKTATYSNPDCVIASEFITIPKEMENVKISSVSIDSENPNKVLLTFFEKEGSESLVYYSENGLDKNPTFKPIGQGLPKNIQVLSSLIEMSNTNIAFLGTSKGLYTTIDLNSANPTWTFVDNVSFKDLAIVDIKQQTNKVGDIQYEDFGVEESTFEKKTYKGVSNYGSIVLGTRGQGAFINNSFLKDIPLTPIGLNENPEKTSVKAQIFPNPVTGNGISNLKINLEKKGDVACYVHDISGRQLFSQNFGELDKGEHLKTIDAGHLNSGTYVLTVVSEGFFSSTKFIVTK